MIRLQQCVHQICWHWSTDDLLMNVKYCWFSTDLTVTSANDDDDHIIVDRNNVVLIFVVSICRLLWLLGCLCCVQMTWMESMSSSLQSLVYVVLQSLTENTVQVCTVDHQRLICRLMLVMLVSWMLLSVLQASVIAPVSCYDWFITRADSVNRHGYDVRDQLFVCFSVCP